MNNNKLIATFMNHDYSMRVSDYHTNWQSLMEVIHKIEWLTIKDDKMLSFLFTINRLHTFIQKKGDEGRPPFIQNIIESSSEEDRLKSAYKSVIQFITYYTALKINTDDRR